MIEKVSSGDWDPKQSAEDRQQKDAMAARGYYQAFQVVKDSIRSILEGENSGEVVDNNHGNWYRELFAPSVAVGLAKASDLAGYRNGPVYITGAMHTPPRHEAVRDTMPVLFDLLKEEPEVSVRVVLGHFIFVYIHPYFDGNGRMARFLMNVMLAMISPILLNSLGSKSATPWMEKMSNRTGKHGVFIDGSRKGIIDRHLNCWTKNS
jgi:hypothetical protein